jgi:hypothetical protein
MCNDVHVTESSGRSFNDTLRDTFARRRFERLPPSLKREQQAEHDKRVAEPEHRAAEDEARREGAT